MAQQIIQMSPEQLQQLINSVSEAAISSAASAATDAANVKSKGNFASCDSRFGGEQSYTDVEEFITSIETYKDVEQINDEDALKSLSLLFYGLASTWWQGIRKEAHTWKEAIALIREHFAPKKLPYQLYMDIFQKSQDDKTPIDRFVCEKRAIMAQFPEGRHDEEAEIDMIFGLLNIKYRKNIQRLDVKTFRDLHEKGRIIEQNEQEFNAVAESDSGRGGGGKKQKRCTYCSFRGHTFQECRKRKKDSGKNATASED